MVYKINKSLIPRIINLNINKEKMFLVSSKTILFLPAYPSSIKQTLGENGFSNTELSIRLTRSFKNRPNSYFNRLIEDDITDYEYNLEDLEKSTDLFIVIAETEYTARKHYIDFLMENYSEKIEVFKKTLIKDIEVFSAVGISFTYDSNTNISLLSDNFTISEYSVNNNIFGFSAETRHDSLYLDLITTLYNKYQELFESDKYFPHVNALYYRKNTFSINFNKFKISLETPDRAIFMTDKTFKRIFILDSQTSETNSLGNENHTYLDELEDAGISYSELYKDMEKNSNKLNLDDNLQGVIMHELTVNPAICILNNGTSIPVKQDDIEFTYRIFNALIRNSQRFIQINGPTFKIFLDRETFLSSFNINREKSIIYYDDGMPEDFTEFNTCLNLICDYSFSYIFAELEKEFTNNELSPSLLMGDIK